MTKSHSQQNAIVTQTYRTYEFGYYDVGRYVILLCLAEALEPRTPEQVCTDLKMSRNVYYFSNVDNPETLNIKFRHHYLIFWQILHLHNMAITAVQLSQNKQLC